MRHYATIWEAIADRIPDRPALRHGERIITWAQFDDRASRLASALLAHGIGPEDAVGNFLFNGPAYFESFFACLKIRARPFNVNYRYRGDELHQLLDNAQAKALVYSAALRDRVATVVERFDGLMLLVEVGDDDSSPPIPGSRRLEDLLEEFEPAERIERSAEDTYLTFTGGTTGVPKGVVTKVGRSVTSVIWYRDQYLARTPVGGVVDVAMALTESNESLAAIPASPIMHGVGFMFTSVPALLSGGVVTTLESPSFDAHELLATIERTRPNIIGIVGDAFGLPIARALDEGRPGGGPYDTSSLEVISSAGVTWSAPIKERLLAHIPQVALMEACGCTEGVSYGTRTVRRGDPLTSANFVAAPGLMVLAPDRTVLAPGQIGMLAGPTHGSGYHRDPQRSADTFFMIDGVQCGIPGDLGRIEPDRTVTLIGRGFSTINTGGEKVHPMEVEDALRATSLVDDCVVLGIPDEQLGQRVAALVVAKPDLVIDLDELRSSVRQRLAGYKVPQRIVIVDAVPRGPNGKVDHPAATALLTS